MPGEPFTADDRALLEARGIAIDEALRQMTLLTRSPVWRRLDRPCVPGDGIERIPADAQEDLIAAHEDAAHQGRVVKFIPASGAATRMFQDLLDGSTEAVAAAVAALPRFAFRDEVRRHLAASGERAETFAARGLGYADLPKGLIPFHDYPDGPRTAFEEHLAEAAACARDAKGIARVHLTVSPEHVGRFLACLDAVRARHEAAWSTRFEVDFSLQKPSTDTLAVDADRRPFRDAAGRLLLRPSGHGALLDNLGDLAADLVLVKNIDNVVPDRSRPETVRWKKILCGRLVRLQREVFLHAARLRSPDVEDRFIDEAAAFARARFGCAVPALPANRQERRVALLEALDRPLRVCGVVANVGEPGGGPFWVRGAEGTATRQIVESSEVDRDDPEQEAILRRATHFNPVDLACAMRDVEGRPFDLQRYVDPDAAIVTRKSAAGRRLVALERPGLWNGGMAFWNTVFVEVPLATFAPVKSVFDLLRPEHQP